MTSIVEKGPENIIIRGQKVPAWFIDKQGRRFEFESMAILDQDGRFDLSRLTENQCSLYPGAIYEIKS